MSFRCLALRKECETVLSGSGDNTGTGEKTVNAWGQRCSALAPETQTRLSSSGCEESSFDAGSKKIVE